MQGSTSPAKKGSPSCSHATFSRTRRTACCASAAAGSSPNARNNMRLHAVEVHSGKSVPLGWQGLPPLDGLGRGESGGSAFVPMAILPLQGQQPCAPALRSDSGTLRGDFVLSCVCQVAHDLPADRRIRVHQPVKDVHSLLHLPPPPIGSR